MRFNWLDNTNNFRMKKVFMTHRLTIVIVSMFLLLITVSCTRIKNCEYGEMGYFIYLSNPQINDNNITVRAYFVPQQPNLNIDSLSVVLINSESSFTHNLVYSIRGYIPSEFKKKPNIPIPVICELNPHLYINGFNSQPIKIVCIEKI